MDAQLKIARIEYPPTTSFLTATGMLDKRPLIVTSLKVANHFDRLEQIKGLEAHILSVHNNMFPRRFRNKYSKIDFSVCSSFLAEIKNEKEERDYLISLKSDIIEIEGGVVYCGETNTWASKI